MYVARKFLSLLEKSQLSFPKDLRPFPGLLLATCLSPPFFSFFGVSVGLIALNVAIDVRYECHALGGCRENTFQRDK